MKKKKCSTFVATREVQVQDTLRFTPTLPSAKQINKDLAW